MIPSHPITLGREGFFSVVDESGTYLYDTRKHQWNLKTGERRTYHLYGKRTFVNGEIRKHFIRLSWEPIAVSRSESERVLELGDLNTGRVFPFYARGDEVFLSSGDSPQVPYEFLAGPIAICVIGQGFSPEIGYLEGALKTRIDLHSGGYFRRNGKAPVAVGGKGALKYEIAHEGSAYLLGLPASTRNKVGSLLKGGMNWRAGIAYFGGLDRVVEGHFDTKSITLHPASTFAHQAGFPACRAQGWRHFSWRVVPRCHDPTSN